MRLVRYGARGHERPGLLDRDDRIRDISAIVPDITGATLGRQSLAKLRAVDADSLPLVKEPVRLGPCVGAVRNFIAIGLNYEDHARETNAPIPSEPILFT